MTAGRHSYRRNLPHYQSDFRTYFVTFVTLGGLVIPSPARDLALRHVLFDHRRRMSLYTAVIMPEHVHMVMAPLLSPDGFSFSLAEILQGIKGASARSINRLLGRRGALWLDESFDHELRNDDSLLQKCEYVAQNPVRRGLVDSPDKYPWLWRYWIDDEGAGYSARAARAGEPAPR